MEVVEVTSRACLKIFGSSSGRYERVDGSRAVTMRRWDLLATNFAISRPIPVEHPVTR